MEHPNAREFYRIYYPEHQRPRLVLRNCIHEVIDCSERGLRFRMTSAQPPPIGTELSGRLRLRRGQEVPIEGVVARVKDGEVALRLLEPGLSFHVILKEQLELRKGRSRPVELADAESDAGSGAG